MKSYNGFQGSVNWIRLRSLSEQPAATEKQLKNDLVIVRASFHMFLIYNQNFFKAEDTTFIPCISISGRETDSLCLLLCLTLIKHILKIVHDGNQKSNYC